MSMTAYELVQADGLVESENAWEIMERMIRRYAKKDLESAQHLISLIPDVAESALDIVGKRSGDNYRAAHWLLMQRKMEPDKEGYFFASMLPVCMVLFPNGNAKGGNEAEKEYFDLFLEQFRNPKVFNWKDDGDWAKSYGYDKYLRLVEEELRKG